MKRVLTIIMLVAGLSLYAQNKNVTKETKTTKVTVNDGTDPKTLVKTERLEAEQNIELKDANTNKLNKDIKPTPVMVRKSTSVSGDYIPPQQLGQTVRYQMNGEDYIFITDKSGYQVQAANNKNYAKLRRTSNDNYIYRTNDKVSISYFDNEGNLVVETYDDSNDAVTKEVYTRVQQ